jgi:hypothetical protein
MCVLSLLPFTEPVAERQPTLIAFMLLVWGAPGAFAVRWGVGGARSWVIVTAQGLTIKNALRTHVIPWDQIAGIDVLPNDRNGRAITIGAVRVKRGGRSVGMSCTALPFGWVWNGEKRRRTVYEFVQPLTDARQRFDRAQQGL